MPQRHVLVEVKVEGDTPLESAFALARNWVQLGFVVDETYRAVPMGDATSSETSVIIRGALRENARVDELKNQPQVIGVWEDAPIQPTGMA